jgi:Ribonuclease G/E
MIDFIDMEFTSTAGVERDSKRIWHATRVINLVSSLGVVEMTASASPQSAQDAFDRCPLLASGHVKSAESIDWKCCAKSRRRCDKTVRRVKVP